MGIDLGGFLALKVVGSLYLVYLGVRSLSDAVRGSDVRSDQNGRLGNLRAARWGLRG
jgi:threonine/homoserine/homoserine lactone efflux protein